MIPFFKIIWHEMSASQRVPRVTEPELMNDADQVKSYIKAYEWGGPTSALQLVHLKNLSAMIKPGDTVVDLACGPGPLLLELAALFPETHFIGIDLSSLMLESLCAEAKLRDLKNIIVLKKDIRTVEKADIGGGADVVISTSALHHLPNLVDLEATFKTIKTILNKNGGIYLFDFGLLKSAATRFLLVKELEKTAPPLTVQDYAMSLDACFPIKEVFTTAKKYLPMPLILSRSSFVDFYYFIKSAPIQKIDLVHQKKIDQIWNEFTFQIKLEHVMIEKMQKRIKLADIQT